MRLVFAIGTGLALLKAFSPNSASGDITVGRSEGKSAHKKRACTVQELLPLPCQSKSAEWTDEYITEHLYNCTCATMKARYFCPNQGDSSYPVWEPRAVSQGACRSKPWDDMIGAPLPPNAKILLYGNSHLRQVMEATMCIFQEKLESKVVTLGSPGVESTVAGDMQCRAFPVSTTTDWVSPLQTSLLDHQCIAKGDIYRCEDSQGEYLFDNGALVHFQFSGTEDTKGLTAARNRHGMDDISSFDAVFVNPGNNPPIGAEKAVEIALEVQAAGTQLFWLSTYSESGEISKWSKDQRARFNECGALYVDISCMARGMNSWTKGDVEGVADGHFCMPGPPNEIALLLLRMVWAVFEERK